MNGGRRAGLVVAVCAALLAVSTTAGLADSPQPSFATKTVQTAEAGAAAFCRKQPGVTPEQCAAFDARVVSEQQVEAYEQSWTHRALTLQRGLDDAAPLLDEMIPATHNSFNSSSYPTTVTNQDPNQSYGLTEQLRMDIRFLELDVHWVPSIYGDPRNGGYAVVLCHGTSEPVGPAHVHVGCSDDRPFTDGLAEIRMWLNAHPDEVVFLYLENQLDNNPTAHAVAAADIQQELGDLVLKTPPGQPCAPMPLTMSRADIRAAGKRVLIVGNCGPGAWGTWVHERGPLWDESDEGQGNQYPSYPQCLALRGPNHYDTHWIRWFEDSTWLAAAMGGGGTVTGPEIAAMVRCGVNMPSLDQASPDDGRLPDFVWSWAPGQPAGAGRCAQQSSDARFRAGDCAQHLAYACTDGHGAWKVTHRSGPWGGGFAACPAQFPGTHFGVPPNGYRNQLLAGARPAGVDAVWLNYDDAGGPWAANASVRPATLPG